MGKRKYTYDKKTGEWVKESTKFGATKKLMCQVLGMHPETFDELYGKDVAQAKLEASKEVGGRIFKEASSDQGDPKLATFYAEKQLGWSNKTEEDVDKSEQSKNTVIEELANIIAQKKDRSDETDNS